VNWASFGYGMAAMLAWLAAATALTVPLGRALKRRAGGQPAPGTAPPPVPGTPSGPGRSPLRPAPAPGPSRVTVPRHHTGGLDYAVKAWKCGCIILFDGRGAITGCTPCAPAGDLDEELRGLTS
jgi:hypothetical protein